MSSDSSTRSPWTGVSQFLPTTRRLLEFSNCKGPKEDDKEGYSSVSSGDIFTYLDIQLLLFILCHCKTALNQ